jgi:hypothetical protein
MPRRHAAVLYLGEPKANSARRTSRLTFCLYYGSRSTDVDVVAKAFLMGETNEDDDAVIEFGHRAQRWGRGSKGM